MFDELGPKRKALRFESLENRVAPGVFLPFWLGSFDADPIATSEVRASVVRSLRDRSEVAEQEGATESRTVPRAVREISFSPSDGPGDRPTRVEADLDTAQLLTRFPAAFRSTERSDYTLLASLFGDYEREEASPFVKARMPAVNSPASTFAPSGGGTGATGSASAGGTAGRTTGQASSGAAAASSGIGTSSASGATGFASEGVGADSTQSTGGASGTQGTASGDQATPDCGCGSGKGTSAADSNSAAASPLQLVDASGAEFNVAFDQNTIVVGAATWCGACAMFKSQLAQVSSQLDGLRLVFAFGDEGGSGPGGVVNPSYLAGLPGEVAFLAPNSIQPERFPSAFNPETNSFDRHAAEAVGEWMARNVPVGATGSASENQTNGSTGGASGTQEENCGCGGGSTGKASGTPTNEEDLSGGGGSVLVGDYNGDGRVDAADYVVFRDTFGSMTDLRADGSDDMEINPADYVVWSANFGSLLAPGAFSITGPLSPSTTDDILITWEASAYATEYLVVLSDNADLSDPIVESEVTGTSKAYNDLGERTLYIGLFAMNAVGTTAAANGPYELVIDTPDIRQTIFVTDIEYFLEDVEVIPPATPYFGSALAADYECTRLASQAGLLDEPWDGNTIYYKAMLTEELIDLEDRANTKDYGYKNVNGDQIASNRAELYDGNFAAPILTQNGDALVGNVPVWTGSTSTGEWSGFTCANWHDPESAGGTVGNLNGVGGAWLDNGTQACHLGARFYCISL